MGLGPMVKQLPCGQCAGCRLERSRQQAARCIHEAKSHRFNTWATLTYDDDHLPSRFNTGLIHPHTRKTIYGGTLNVIDVPRMLRAMRKALSKRGGIQTIAHEKRIVVNADMGRRPIPRLKSDLRYYYSGEYGETYQRPHYHICLFGIEFLDRKHIDTTDAGYKVYTSKTLSKLWPHGDHMIGELTFETAAYTARYIMKKITGQKQKQHYTVMDHETGEMLELLPEFNQASRRPGLGREHYEKFKTDFYKSQTSSVNVRGHHSRPPRYYDKQYEKENPEHYKTLKFTRQMDAIRNKRNFTPARLAAEEIITLTKLKSLKGKL